MSLFAIALLATLGSCPDVVLDAYVPGQLLITLTPDCRDVVSPAKFGQVSRMGIAELDALNDRWGVRSILKLVRNPNPNELAKKYGLDLMYLLTADSAVDVMAMMRDYAACPRIEYVSPNILRPLCDVPSDPMYVNQWHHANIMSVAAWDLSHGDTNVRIGIVDDGVDYHHPDIARNLWINVPEDINHNGRFDPYAPPGDLDGNDDDGNGYVDDVIGYDFVDGDPDPHPVGSDDHGTHCWGNGSAVTNNDTGVASVAWGCRGVALRAGQGGSVNMAAAVQAIYYSVEKEVWVTSHSYGSTQGWPQEQAAMQYSWDMGAVVCAAAGNNGSTSPHYPGAYEVCIAVAASDQANHRASWSNYGDWIEVAAPGEGILSTVPDGYQAQSGTSMATPVTASLCALMKASEPGLTNQQCRDRLLAACDTMPDEDYRNGLLGHGRINAMKAVGMSRRCWLEVTNVHLNDPNGNGVAEPGELIGVTVTLTNGEGWQTAGSVTASLVCNDPAVTIIKGDASFPNIAPGASASCAADSFVFTVNSGAVPHHVSFRIDNSANPANLAPSYFTRFQVGMPRILLVDDYATDNVAKWYRWACDSLRVLYDRYDVAASGAPSSDTLRHYPVVIWFTGLDSTNLLSSACQLSLASYLDNGGKLLISGQNIGQVHGSTPFYTNYLHAQFDNPSTGKIFTLGLAGDPIGRGDTIVFGGAGGAGNARSNDAVRPVGGAFGCVIYRDYADTTVYAAVRYDGAYHVLYFSAPFEAIDHATARYVQKWTILRRFFDLVGEPVPEAVAEPALAGEHFVPLVLVPNPARSQTQISYTLSQREHTTVRVYDGSGRVVRTVFAGIQPPGVQQLHWDLRDRAGRRVADGVYFCALLRGSESRLGKLLVAH